MGAITQCANHLQITNPLLVLPSFHPPQQSVPQAEEGQDVDEEDDEEEEDANEGSEKDNEESEDEKDEDMDGGDEQLASPSKFLHLLFQLRTLRQCSF